MGSTVQAPPPPAPPMRPMRPRRSIAGPVVLIIVGVVFLLHSIGVLPWYHWGHWFAHYWPLLLILWGVIKLIEYQQANRAGVRPSGIGAGGFLLVILLVVGGLLAGEFERWKPDWQGLCDNSDTEDMPWCGHTYTFSDDHQQAFPTGDSLHVNNQRGAVNITSSEDNQLHVTVHKRVRADREEQASNWDKSTRPQVSVNGQVVTVDANAGGAGDHPVTSDLDVAVPRKAAVVVSTRHGDVSIMGRDGNADVTSQNGDVSATDLNGSLALTLTDSSARISQVSSDVTVQGRAKDISLEDVKGTVRLNGDFQENVRLSRISKPVYFQSSRTEMTLAKLEGDLSLDSGDLNATNVVGPLHLRTSAKDIIVSGASGDVRVDNENGTVEIHFNKVGNTEVSDHNSDIRIFVPQKAGFQLEAQTRDGEIQSDFNSLNINNNDDRSTASGAVNGGGPRIVINNEHGGIEIRSGGMVPAPPNPPTAPKTSKEKGTAEPPEPSEN